MVTIAHGAYKIKHYFFPSFCLSLAFDQSKRKTRECEKNRINRTLHRLFAYVCFILDAPEQWFRPLAETPGTGHTPQEKLLFPTGKKRNLAGTHRKTPKNFRPEIHLRWNHRNRPEAQQSSFVFTQHNNFHRSGSYRDTRVQRKRWWSTYKEYHPIWCEPHENRRYTDHITEEFTVGFFYDLNFIGSYWLLEIHQYYH